MCLPVRVRSDSKLHIALSIFRYLSPFWKTWHSSGNSSEDAAVAAASQALSATSSRSTTNRRNPGSSSQITRLGGREINGKVVRTMGSQKSRKISSKVRLGQFGSSNHFVTSLKVQTDSKVLTPKHCVHPAGNSMVNSISGSTPSPLFSTDPRCASAG